MGKHEIGTTIIESIHPGLIDQPVPKRVITTAKILGQMQQAENRDFITEEMIAEIISDSIYGAREVHCEVTAGTWLTQPYNSEPVENLSAYSRPVIVTGFEKGIGDTKEYDNRWMLSAVLPRIGWEVCIPVETLRNLQPVPNP